MKIKNKSNSMEEEDDTGRERLRQERKCSAEKTYGVEALCRQPNWDWFSTTSRWGIL